MLGKGLESLIPPNKGIQQGGDNNDEKKSEPTLVPPASLDAPLPSGTGMLPVAHDEVAREKLKRLPLKNAIEGNAVFHIEVEKIKPNPHQPRREFNEDSLRELAESIREVGIIQPLVVTKIEKEVPTGTEVEYELIAGERRLMAAKLLGLERVPVVVRRVDAERERLEMAIIENLQRESLNPIDTARAFSQLQDEFRLTQREIATRLGKSREVVANTVRLLDLPSYIQDALSKGQISESHGRLLLAVGDAAAQEAIFRDLVDRHLTTRELKERVWRLKPAWKKDDVHTAVFLSPELLSLQEKLSAELGTPVKIEQHGEAGKITIAFYSGEELKNLAERLGGKEEV